MPVIVPFTLARIFTPSETADGSFTDVEAGTVASLHTEHGQVPEVAAAVVKLHVSGLMVLFAASFAPLSDTVYEVPAASAAVGLKVAVRLGAS
jgi:hypothetical protein